MGWKLAVVVAPLEGRALEDFVDEIYGGPQTLAPSDVCADAALYPDDQAERFALAHEGMGWVFDWDLITRAFARPLPIKGRAFAFVLHSVVNWYGFAELKNGAYLRCRAGDSDNGIMIEEGEPSVEEAALVTAFAKPGEEVTAAWATWIGARASFDGVYENMTHDGMGEDVVFGLMQHALGFRLDHDAPACDAFREARVMRIMTPPKRKRFGWF
jgi:hypothetical protein